MNRRCRVPFNSAALTSMDPYKEPQTSRNKPPGDLREATGHTPMKTAANSKHRTSDMVAQANPARAAQPPAVKWRSSFKALDDRDPEDGDSEDQSTSGGLQDSDHLQLLSRLSAVEAVEAVEAAELRHTASLLTEGVTHNPAKRTSDMVHQIKPALKRAAPPVQHSDVKWASTFKALGDLSPEDGRSQDKSTSSWERSELYDPFDPHLSDFEAEAPCSSNPTLAERREILEHGLNPGRSWNVPVAGRLDLGRETRATEVQVLSPGHRLSERRDFSPGPEPLVLQQYTTISRPLDHRRVSPHRFLHSSPTQPFPPAYGGQKINGGELPPAEGRSKMITRVSLSPPRLQQSGYERTGLDGVAPSAALSGNKSKHLCRSILTDKSPITCDLCDVELANGHELECHLDSKTHWDTLAHIQQQNNYDDLTIAFLQEVLIYKSQKCNRAIDESALPALQENDHMMKYALFHCAACQVFVSTSALSVQSHITSQEHLSQTKVFEVQQRRSCLSKADAMLHELKPQFEHFMKGGNPFNDGLH